MARENPSMIGQRQSQAQEVPIYSRPLGHNDDFTGTWMDATGIDFVLEQSGSIVMERTPGGESSCGMAVRNELTMYGRVGTLADDLIRWSDGSVWARCDTDAPIELPTRPAPRAAAGSSAAAELGAKPWKKRGAYDHRLPPDLANLVTPGPGAEEEGRFVGGRGRTAGRADHEGEQRLWFAPWTGQGL